MYINNSEKLLFSIPVHENQDIINNQIENILNFNPNAKIIIHVNKTYTTFNNNLSVYDNVYINSNKFGYKATKGLLWIHINNFLEAKRLNIPFEYFVIISSNEMFIKRGLITYIEKYKNGMQLVEFSKDVNWHNFKKGIENDKKMIELLEELKLPRFYGSQTEGVFYSDLYFD